MNKVFFFIFISLFACEKKEVSFEEMDEKIESSNMKYSQSDDREYYSVNKEYYPLLKKAINNGDTISYDAVSKIVDMDGGHAELFYYSLIMANKYNYSKANMDVYYILNRYRSGTINHIKAYSSDKNTQQIANYYLLRAYEQGNKDAKYQVKRVFRESIPKSTDYLCENEK